MVPPPTDTFQLQRDQAAYLVTKAEWFEREMKNLREERFSVHLRLVQLMNADYANERMHMDLCKLAEKVQKQLDHADEHYKYTLAVQEHLRKQMMGTAHELR